MATWTRYSTSGSEGRARSSDIVEFGPGDVTALDRRLLGDVSDQRVLDLGSGAGHSAIAMAKRGARVVAIDPDEAEVDAARAAAEAAEVRLEVHSNDLADLAFLQADTFDTVISVHSLATVADIGRVFRQVHRLLKSDRPLILSLPHPAGFMVDPDDRNKITTAYHDTETLGEGHFLTHRHSVSHTFTELTRANYRVDMLLETPPASGSALPASVIFRARKIGT